MELNGPRDLLSPGTCLKHKVVQGNQSFMTFERYFQNFHSVFDQLCDLLPWQSFVIVNGCPCVFGPGGGCFSRFSIFVKVVQKPSELLQKSFLNSFLTFELSELNNLPMDVSTHTCKTQQPFTRCIPIVTWMSSKDTQRGPQCPLKFAGRWGLPKSAIAIH